MYPSRNRGIQKNVRNDTFWLIFTISERKTMRKLALSDEILLSVDKAARYIGGEVNSIMKDKDKVNTRVAFCFPDVFGMLFPSFIFC